MSAPAPPSASGNGTPSRPSSAACRSSSSGKRPRVELLGDRADLALGELAHGVAEQPVLVREVEIHSLHDTGRTTMPRVDDGSLARYADAIVRDGLLIGSGDVLAVHPEPIQREFAIALTEAGYRAGARYVDVLEAIPASRAPGRSLAPEDTLDERPAGRTRACASSCARARASSGSPAARIRRHSPTCRPRVPCGGSPIARACPLTGAPWGAPTRASRWWPGRARPGRPRSTPSSSRRRRRGARQRPAAVRAPRRRRSSRRLAASRRALTARARASPRSTCASSACGPRHRPPPGAARRGELARWSQRRARPAHHAEHAHRRGVHEPRPRPPPAPSAARARWPSRAG